MYWALNQRFRYVYMEALLSFNAIYVVNGSKNNIPIRVDKASLINISY